MDNLWPHSVRYIIMLRINFTSLRVRYKYIKADVKGPGLEAPPSDLCSHSAHTQEIWQAVF